MGIDTDAAKRIFVHLVAEGVTIEWSVPFLIHLRGWRIQAFCNELGIHRAYLHALLQQQYEAKLDIRYAVYKRLGFDPWYQAQALRADTSTPDAIPCAGREIRAALVSGA